MLTFFTIPKPFDGHTGTIQNNAILSWKKIKPDCEIIIFGNDKSVIEFSEDIGVKCVSDIKLNEYGFEHGIGREDIVENRFVGMKSRGIYETPGGSILLKAHRAIESITLDKGEAHLKDEIMPKYAETIYNGYWFSSERVAMQKLIDTTQNKVTGDVRLKLFRGNIIISGRKSPFSKYKLSLVINVSFTVLIELFLTL